MGDSTKREPAHDGTSGEAASDDGCWMSSAVPSDGDSTASDAASSEERR